VVLGLGQQAVAVGAAAHAAFEGGEIGVDRVVAHVPAASVRATLRANCSHSPVRSPSACSPAGVSR
jgi:hypothetical protein